VRAFHDERPQAENLAAKETEHHDNPNPEWQHAILEQDDREREIQANICFGIGNLAKLALSRRAMYPSRLSVAVPQRNTTRATADDVVRPPASLPSKYAAPKPRNSVRVLAIPIVGNSLPWSDRLRPRCQNWSLCCHRTHTTRPGSRASRTINPVTHCQDVLREGLACAVWQERRMLRWRNCQQACGRKRSRRRVVSRSTTTICSVCWCMGKPSSLSNAVERNHLRLFVLRI
jgi:hypothetical protein